MSALPWTTHDALLWRHLVDAAGHVAALISRRREPGKTAIASMVVAAKRAGKARYPTHDGDQQQALVELYLVAVEYDAADGARRHELAAVVVRKHALAFGVLAAPPTPPDPPPAAAAAGYRWPYRDD